MIIWEAVALGALVVVVVLLTVCVYRLQNAVLDLCEDMAELLDAVRDGTSDTLEAVSALPKLGELFEPSS